MPGHIEILSNNRIVPPEVNIHQQPNANLPRQVSPTNNARVKGGNEANASSADKLHELARGGLKVATGYKPSIKSWISSKLFSVSNYLRGEQASFPATDRRGNVTFRQLERLASDVIKTEPYKNGSKEAKGQYHQSLLNFQAALTSYIESKPVNSGFRDLLSSIDSELRSIHEAHDYTVVIRPPQLHPSVEIEDRNTNAANHYGKAIEQPLPKPSEHYSSMAQVQPMPSVTTTSPSGVQPQVIPEGKQEVGYSMEGPLSNSSNTVDLRQVMTPDQRGSTNPANHYGKVIPQPQPKPREHYSSMAHMQPVPSVTTTSPSGVQPQVISEGKQEVGWSMEGPLSNNSNKVDLRQVMTPDQRKRLDALTTDRAREVLARAHGGTRDLNLLLDEAQKSTFDTRSPTEQVAAKRAQLTGSPASGGLGIKLSELARGKRLGDGNFGDVYRYETKSDDPSKVQRFAGKVAKGSDQLLDEEAMLARLPEHENLVKSYGLHKIGEEHVLLQELVSGGSLKDTLATLQWDMFTPEQQLLTIKHVATQMFRGLAELQKLGIVHRDVRLENLLFDKETFNIKLADFGMSTERGVNRSDAFPIKWGAPEVLREATRGERRASVTGDTFSASRVLVGELVDQFNLFNLEIVVPQNSRKGLFSITNDDVGTAARQDHLPEKLHPDTLATLNKLDPTGEFAKFFEAAFNPNPSKRLRADQALKHEFLANPPTREQLQAVFNPPRLSTASSQAESLNGSGQSQSTQPGDKEPALYQN